MDQQDGFEGWAVLELMGHRRLAGKVSPATLGGSAVIRIDVPKPESDGYVTQFYAGSALYALTPTTEELARRIARGAQPAPVQPWELDERPALPARASTAADDDARLL